MTWAFACVVVTIVAAIATSQLPQAKCTKQHTLNVYAETYQQATEQEKVCDD